MEDASLSEDYLKGYNDALNIAKKIFFEFVDERADKGVFHTDLDHVRAYKRWFTERMKHQGGFSRRR